MQNEHLRRIRALVSNSSQVGRQFVLFSTLEKNPSDLPMDPNQLQAQLILQSGLMSQSQIEAIYQQLAQYPDQDLLSLVLHRGCIDPQSVQGLRQQLQSYDSSLVNSHDHNSAPINGSSHPQSSRLPSPALAEAEHSIVDSVREVLKENEWFKPTGELCWLQKDLLGEGGMGKVFRVEDICLGRDAALKIMHSEDEASLSRFKREVIITARLDHPSIPPVYEAGRTADGIHYMVMKIVEGETLKDRLARVHKTEAAPSDIRDLLQCLIKVGEALSCAHSNNIVHRDLKPENIMLGEHGEVFVMDWGIARDLDADISAVSEQLLGQALSMEEMNRAGITLTGVLIGTPGYMAPEQADGVCSEKNDIFALGVILTEILTGVKSIPGDSMIDRIAVTVSGKAKTPREINSKISRELDILAKSALEVDESQRLGTAKDFVENLNAHLTGEPLPVYQYSVTERLTRWTAKRPGWILGFAASFLFLSASLVGLQAFKRSEQAKNVALDIADKAQDSEAKTKAAFLKLREAEILAERGSPKDKILAAVNDAISLGGKDYSLLLSAASICKNNGLIERCKELLNTATELDTRAYDALFMLHEIEMMKFPLVNFFYSKPARELVRRSKQHNEDNEFTVIIRAIELHTKNQFEDALEAISKLEQYSTKLAHGYYVRGIIHFDLKQIDQAKKNFDLAIQKDPLFANAYNSRGVLATRAGRHRAAFLDFSGAIKINPRFVSAYCNRSQCYLDLRKPSLALKDVNTALKLDPSHSESYANRAVIRAQLNDSDGAKSDLDEAIRLNPKNSRAYTNRAILRHNTGKLAASISDLQNALKYGPENGLAYAFRGRLKMEKKDYEGALKDFALAIQYNPHNGNAYRLRGILRRQQGDASGAAEDYTEAIRCNSADTTSYINRGVLLKGRGDLEGALNDFNKAIQISEMVPEAYSNRGTIYKKRKQWALALSDYQKAAKLNPKAALYRKNIGIVKFSLGDMRAAEDEFSAAIRLDPNYSEYYNMRASARLRLKNTQGSLADLNSAIKHGPQNGLAYLNRAFVRQSLQDHTGALSDYKHGIRLRPKDPAGYLKRALLLKKLGQFKSALRDLNRVYELSPQNASAIAARAVVKMELGQFKEGALDYERYLKLKPNSKSATKMRAIIKQELKRPSKY